MKGTFVMIKRLFSTHADAHTVEATITQKFHKQNTSRVKKRVRTIWLASVFTLLPTALTSMAIAFRRWQQQELRHIQENGMIITTTSGPLEYQSRGQGPAVIYAHGTPGGYDQGLAFAQFFDLEACTVISPSRPGYLQTPQTSGASPEEQADLYAALLDSLDIEKASVIGFSGGGPSAIQFALRHPDRCHSLIMIGAIVQRYSQLENIQMLIPWQRASARLTEHLLVSDLFLYCILPIIRLLPKGHVMAGMLCSGTIYQFRKAGYQNDQKHFAAIEQYPVEKISVPTLIVHGTADDDVPFKDAMFLMNKIQHVTLVPMNKGNHATFFLRANILIPIIQQFITQDAQRLIH
jgi:pimeloyl-ACP methyl ester carboxylesterase